MQISNDYDFVITNKPSVSVCYLPESVDSSEEAQCSLISEGYQCSKLQYETSSVSVLLQIRHSWWECTRL